MLQFDFCQGGIFPLRPSARLLLPDDFPNFSKKASPKIQIILVLSVFMDWLSWSKKLSIDWRTISDGGYCIDMALKLHFTWVNTRNRITEISSYKYFFSVYIRCMYIVYILIQAWFKSGGDTTKPFRPELEDSYLPEEYAARSGMKKVKMLCM